MNIISYFKQCFAPPKVVIAPNEAEQIAIRNIVMLAKERLWLADTYPKKPEPSMDFDTMIDDDVVERSRVSIQVVEHFMLKYHNMEPDQHDETPRTY